MSAVKQIENPFDLFNMLSLKNIKSFINIEVIVLVEEQELFYQSLVFVFAEVVFKSVVVTNREDLLEVSRLLESHKQLQDVLLLNQRVFIS